MEEATTAPSASLGLRKLSQNSYDLVLIDSDIKDMKCLDFLLQTQKDFPHIEVLVVGSSSSQDAVPTIRALEKGAMAFVEKPDQPQSKQALVQLRNDLQPLFRTLKTRRLTKLPPGQGTSSFPKEKAPVKKQSDEISRAPSKSLPLPEKQFEVVAIGISTGGPNALMQLIPAFPQDFPLPILIVLHMPTEFTATLANDLDKKSHLRVKEAQEGEQIKPGLILLAPGGRHMLVRKKDNNLVVGLDDGPKENSCRPAVDVLFRSLASCYNEDTVLAIIMTGMGNDGMRGMESLKKKSCYSITQSEQSCVVYGMPKAVDDESLSDESQDLADLAPRICEIVMPRRNTK